MCLDAYVVSTIVASRLEEARAEAERHRLVAELRTPFTVRLGRALIRVGTRLAAEPARRVQPSTT
jgi:hypothetical protein